MALLSNRELACLVHELCIAVKGRIARESVRPVVLTGVQATELLIGNCPTSESFSQWAPIGLFQKTTLIHCLKGFMAASGGGLVDQHWNYSMTKIAPFYPRVGNKRTDAGLFITAQGNPFAPLFIDPDTSRLEPHEWDAVRVIEGGATQIPGNIQLYIDAPLHYIMVHIEEFAVRPQETMQKLVDQFPNSRTDILLASLLFWQARQNHAKDTSMFSVPGLSSRS